MSQFINGKILEGTSGATVDVIDPSNGSIVATISLAGSDDVKLAVQAARDAFPAWSRATPAERSAVLTKFAELMAERAEEFAQLESKQAGKPIRLTREFDVPGTIDNIAYPLKLEGKSKADVDRRMAELVASFDVKFEGKNVCRLGDPLFHNRKNIMG